MPGECGDLAYQEKLTQTSSTATPVYTGLDDPGEVLGVPVAVTSFGPTCADKMQRSTRLR